jgi:outer membrane protein
MKKSVLALAVTAALAPSFVLAEAGDWVVRLRGTHVSPDESSDLGGRTDRAYGAGTAALVYGSADANLLVDSNTIPELDISYYFTDNIAAELILAVGTRHDVKVSGNGGVLADRDLGSVNLLPPVLTLQWHFMPDRTFDPYIGAGVSWILSLDRKLDAEVGAAELPIRIDRNAWGPALQVGFDVNLKDGWLVNFDAKKVWFDTDVRIDAGAAGLPAGYRKIDDLDIDPWIISVGFGRRF